MSEEMLKFGEYVFGKVTGMCKEFLRKGEDEGLRSGEIIFTIAYGLLASVVSLYRSAGMPDDESKHKIKDMLNRMYSGDGDNKEES